MLPRCFEAGSARSVCLGRPPSSGLSGRTPGSDPFELQLITDSIGQGVHATGHKAVQRSFPPDSGGIIAAGGKQSRHTPVQITVNVRSIQITVRICHTQGSEHLVARATQTWGADTVRQRHAVVSSVRGRHGSRRAHRQWLKASSTRGMPRQQSSACRILAALAVLADRGAHAQSTPPALS